MYQVEGLSILNRQRAICLSLDPKDPKLLWRMNHLSQEMLLKACGLLKKQNIKNKIIVDATAGLAQDATLLAYTQAKTYWIEQHPLLGSLLSNYASALMSQKPELQVIVLQGNACGLLSSIQSPDVVYLDPMFPKSSKDALPNKKAVFLRSLHASSEALAIENHSRELLKAALFFGKRIVLKRPKHAPLLFAHHPPHTTLRLASCKFEIYQGTRNLKCSL